MHYRSDLYLFSSKSLFFTVVIIAGFLQLSCKKQIHEIPENILCNGNGENNYIPLSIGNKWIYKEYGSPNSSNEVIGDTTINSKKYFQLKLTQQSTNSYNYLRITSNGDIYSYYSDTLEYLFLPANPSINQVICTYPSNNPISTRVVKAINETREIGGCIYSGVLKIQDYNQGGTAYTTYYYKKGLGLIESITWGSKQLTAVTLN